MKRFFKRVLLPQGKAARRVPFGVFAGLRAELDFANQTQLWLGLQERELSQWFRTFSLGIASAVDAGANEGFYTLYFLARTPARKVIAFEPSEDCAAQLHANVALNKLRSDSRLQVVSAFVGCGQDAVQMDQFSDLLDMPCLVKVDIEGAEASLLRGAPTLLAAPDVRWIIEVHSRALEDECTSLLRQSNYKVKIVANSWWRAIIPEKRCGHNRWVVAARPGSPVADAIADSPLTR